MTRNPLLATHGDRRLFGLSWRGPDVLPEMERTLIAEFEKASDGSSQPVLVYCIATPERVYAVSALATESRPAFTMEIGNGSAKLARDVAEAISEGALVLVAREKAGNLEGYATPSMKIVCGFCGLDLSDTSKFEDDEIEVEPCPACIAEARADAQGEEHEPYHFNPHTRI